MTNKRFYKVLHLLIVGGQNDRSYGAHGQMMSVSDEKIRNYVRVLAIVVSSVLPFLAIVVLHFIKSPTARLGAIVAFSALCSATMALLSNAKNIEIIAATAAMGLCRWYLSVAMRPIDFVAHRKR